MLSVNILGSEMNLESFLNTPVYIQSKRSLLSMGEKSYLYLCNRDVSVCGDGYKSEGTKWILRGDNIGSFTISNVYKGKEKSIRTYNDKVFTSLGYEHACINMYPPFVGWFICNNNPFSAKQDDYLFSMEIRMSESTPNRLAVHFRQANRYLTDMNGGIAALVIAPDIWETFYITKVHTV